jgi:hypothetical protein
VAARKDIVFGGLVILAFLLCAALLGPDGPNGPVAWTAEAQASYP